MLVLTVPRVAHQRTTTYELTPGDPPRIDLTTEYRSPVWPAELNPPADPTPAVVGFAFAFAQTGQETLEVAQPLLTSLTLKTQGLIRVRGGRMTYIVSNPGGPRPASFDTRPGDGLTRVTLERVPTRAVNP